MDHVPLLRFMDLRTLDDVRLEWALSLIEGYVEGELQISWPRAIALVALYDLIPPEN
jgi:hypothetical protein